jgi:outer membrane protein assembly factor BamB
VTDGLLVIGGRDKRLHAIDPATGKSLWRFRGKGAFDAAPVICGDKVVAGSEDGRLYLLRAKDGSELWRHEMGKPILSSPAVSRGVVVVGCDDGEVYCFGVAGRATAPIVPGSESR